jgi:hypothetical protein
MSNKISIPNIVNIYHEHIDTDMRSLLSLLAPTIINGNNAEKDIEIIDILKKHNVLDKMLKNLESNFPNGRKKYSILLDNTEWIEGYVIGTS